MAMEVPSGVRSQSDRVAAWLNPHSLKSVSDAGLSSLIFAASVEIISTLRAYLQRASIVSRPYPFPLYALRMYMPMKAREWR